MSETKNELEILLEKAAIEPGHRPAFFRSLLEATVWVPGAAAQGEQVVEDSVLDLQHWEKDDGTSVIPFFTSLAALQAENDLPMVGVVEPTCRRAVLMTQNKRVGLIATAASVRSGAYEAALRRLDPEVPVFSRACPLFVPLAEAGRIRRGDVVIETVAREYLTPLKNAGVDTLILGCTHYPLLTDVIGDVMGPGVELVSAGEESAFELKRMLKARELRADERRRGETEFYVSDRVEDFERTASLFLQEDLRHTARRIDIERY